MIEPEIDAEADEGSTIKAENDEAHKERRAAALARELNILGIESHVDDSAPW